MAWLHALVWGLLAGLMAVVVQRRRGRGALRWLLCSATTAVALAALVVGLGGGDVAAAWCALAVAVAACLLAVSLSSPRERALLATELRTLRLCSGCDRVLSPQAMRCGRCDRALRRGVTPPAVARASLQAVR